MTSVLSENGKPVAIFRNPKDSLDGKHSTQKLPLDGSGVLILPIKQDQKFGEELLGIAKDFTDNPSLDALDKLLKDVRTAYIKKDKVPDMYNANTGHYDVMQLQSSTDNAGAGTVSSPHSFLARIRLPQKVPLKRL